MNNFDVNISTIILLLIQKIISSLAFTLNFISVFEDFDQEEVRRESFPQVHRHQLQVWPRSLPDPTGQGRLLGSSQEGPEGSLGRHIAETLADVILKIYI